MSTSLINHYDFITQQLEDYVQECVNTAADTTHGNKKKEAALRADGAIRNWMSLFNGVVLRDSQESAARYEADMVRLRKMVQDIPTNDQN